MAMTTGYISYLYRYGKHDYMYILAIYTVATYVGGGFMKQNK